ncbi:winged helix-turn-helix domain-containing protein [Cellulomonas sp. S1-8]|uniref:winged helix-turn-helix domain-containing protein n=1 Tax=Cellulomonas sp. S1-8 TaxID=2904790 RepID=UPI002243526E|nr:helix-turn-helix domain-containing protein [Cellulomonas sp. S1-8]UZN03057.1 helix-turn-helix domain-containing protein [Cellulomonas sp. S1-8]
MRHMRTEAPALVPIFRSALQARLLLHILTSDKPATAADLARVLDAPEPTVSREVRRLLDSGLIAGVRIGRATVVSPAVDNPATAPLRQLLIVTYGPARLIEQALAGVDGIEAAYVHGSWAARYQGEAGKAPGDVDVLIVGQPSRAQVDVALDGLEHRLAREVNVTYVSPQRWRDADEPFIAAVRERPLVELHVGRHEQAAAS